MRKWIRLTITLLSVEGVLLLAAAVMLLGDLPLPETHRTAFGVVCAIAGVGMLLPAVIGIGVGLWSAQPNAKRPFIQAQTAPNNM